MKMKHNLIGAGLIVALAAGAFTVPVTAGASAERTSISASATPSRSATTGHNIPVSVGAGVAVSAAAGMNDAAAGQQAMGIGRAFIAAVKKYGASVYKAMVKAIKGGYNNFVKWYNTLPGWVKGAAGTIGTSALYDALKSLLGL